MNSSVLDASLLDIVNNGNLLIGVSTYPTTYEEATVTYRLAAASIATGVTGGGYVPPVFGVVGTRRITINEVDDVPIDVSGTIINIVLVDTVNSHIIHITECDPLYLVSGHSTNFLSWDIIFTDRDESFIPLRQIQPLRQVRPFKKYSPLFPPQKYD